MQLSDDQFIGIWKRCNGNIERVVRESGLKERGVYLRRRKIEDRSGVNLMAEKSGAETVIRKHRARISLTIKDGVLPIAGDVHIWPGELTTVQRAYIELVRKIQPTHVILVGDLFDGARISRHPRIGFLENRPTVAEELKAVGNYVDELKDAAPKGAVLIWCLGNHDARYESYLSQNAPEMEGVEGFHLKDRFPDWVPCWSVHINEGEPSHTVIKHRYHNGIHASYNNTLKSGVNIVTGHLHKLDSRKWADYRGHRYGVDTGVMADVDDPQFVHYTEDNPKDWTSGFAVLTYRDSRLMRPEFVQKWDEGKVEFRGEVIEV